MLTLEVNDKRYMDLLSKHITQGAVEIPAHGVVILTIDE